MQFCQMIISYYVCKTDYSHRKYFSIIFLFCNAFLAEQTQRFPWDISMKNKYSHETQIYSWNIYMKHKYFHENTNISMRHFHETKNLSVKYNIICFEAKIPNRENPRLYFIMWIPKNLITHSCEEGIDPQLCQHSFASRYNQDVHINCQYHPDHCWQGWFCFRALPMIKTKSSLQVPWKYIFRYPPGWWSIFNINQTNPKAIFLVRLRYPNRKLTRKLFHNRQTKLSGYSTTDRIKPSGYSSLLFRWLFHNAFNLKVAQRMGMKIQSYTLSHNNHKQVPSRQVPLHKREDDERVWLRWNN